MRIIKNIVEVILFLVGFFLIFGSVGGLECNTLTIGQALLFVVIGAAALAVDYWLAFMWW